MAKVDLTVPVKVDIPIDDIIAELDHKGYVEKAKTVGVWEERTVIERKDDELQSARCSVCKKYHTTPYLYFFDFYPFCPYCGSPMRMQTDE